jgi:hypothetical protein
MSKKSCGLCESIKKLDDAIAQIQNDDSLTDEQRQIKTDEAFSDWLKSGNSFKEQALLAADYIRHHEALAEGRKQGAKQLQREADQLRARAEEAENEAKRLRNYLSHQMLLWLFRTAANDGQEKSFRDSNL